MEESVHGKTIITLADKEDFHGMKVYHINKNKFNGIPVIYLHGGAYLHGLNMLHFKFCFELSNRIKSPVVLLDYPLLPDASHDKAYEKVLHFIDQYDKYILFGDSAGGGLALGCHLYQVLNGRVIPRKTILMSPWVDVTMSNPEIAEFIESDFILNKDILIELGNRWANKKPTDQYLVSPLFGPCQDLQNVMVTCGSDELFAPDLRKLGHQLNDVNCLYLEGDKMFHDFTLFTNMGLQEADKAFEKIVTFIKK